MRLSSGRVALLFVLGASCVACASVKPPGTASSGASSPTAGEGAAPSDAASATPVSSAGTVPPGEGTNPASASPRGSDSTAAPEGNRADAGGAGGPGDARDEARGGAPVQMQGVPLDAIPAPPKAATEARSTAGASEPARGGGRGSGGTPGATPVPRVRMVPSEDSPAIGALLSIRVFIEGAIAVRSVPFHVVYNPSVLRFERGREGPFLGGGGKETAFFAAPMSSASEMVVGLSRLGAGEGIGGSGELCTLEFTVVGTGDAGLEFTRAHIRDSENRIVPAEFDASDVTAR